MTVAWVSKGQTHIVFEGILVALIIISFIRSTIFVVRSKQHSNRNKKNCIPNCQRYQEASNILSELAREMNVELNPTKSFKVSTQFGGASADGRTVHIEYSVLYCLDNIALKGVLAHELGHIKKKHQKKMRLSYVVFVFISIIPIAYGLSSKSQTIIPFLITFLLFVLVRSFISWDHEFEADRIAAKYIREDMAYALEEFGKLIYRPGDTLDHPSFKKRISRISP